MINRWVGCDLDATVAFYTGWERVAHIGIPIPAMVERIKAHLAAGDEVRILTARVAVPEGMHASERLVREAEVRREREAIGDWTEKVFGVRLRATAQKDFGMVYCYDDRCKQVEPNTGRLIEEICNDPDHV